VIDEIIACLTNQKQSGEGSALPEYQGESLEFKGPDILAALENFNHCFVEQEWGDGYPLLPPTASRVGELLAELERDPHELICLLNPGMGHATVEAVATNCAMAGCSADEMRVVVAALRAISKTPPPLDKSVLMSTGAFAPLLLVSGPVAERLRVNGGRCCLGPGRANSVNLRIGRAVTLCLKNLGRWIPGVMDLDTIGTPRKFKLCLAENMEESPWESYHVSQGFRPDDSTVTVLHTTGEWHYDIHGCTH